MARSGRPVHSTEPSELRQQRSRVVGGEKRGAAGGAQGPAGLARGAEPRDLVLPPGPARDHLLATPGLWHGFQVGRRNGAGDGGRGGLPGLKTRRIGSARPGGGVLEATRASRALRWGAGPRVGQVGGSRRARGARSVRGPRGAHGALELSHLGGPQGLHPSRARLGGLRGARAGRGGAC